MPEPRRHIAIPASPDAFGRDLKLRIGEHDERAFVGIDAGNVSQGVMMEPVALIAAANEFLAIAGNILQRQFEKRLGSP